MSLDTSNYYSTACIHANNKSVLSFTAAERQDDLPLFDALITEPLLFREAFNVFHAVITHDINEQLVNRNNFDRWLRQNKVASELLKHRKRVSESEQLSSLKDQLRDHIKQHRRVLFSYQKAQKHYLRYRYQKYLEQHLLIEPWVTVNPDVIFFEIFSLSQLLYCRLDLDSELFSDIKARQYGTSTIAYDPELDRNIEKIRNYRQTRLLVESSEKQQANNLPPLQSKTLEREYLRGLLQINTAMGLLTEQIVISPLDLYNICHFLNNQKQCAGSDALEYVLEPGHAIKVNMGMAGKSVICTSIYQGKASSRIRHWFCRELLIMARLIPFAEKVVIHAKSTGWPVFYVVHMQHLRLTFAISGWRSGDWSRKAFHDLLQAGDLIDDFTRVRILKAIWENRSGTAYDMAKILRMSEKKVAHALQRSLQEGAVMYDFSKKVYRFRQWIQDEINVAQYRFEDELEAKAHLFVDQDKVHIDNCTNENGRILIQGTVTDKAIDYQPDIMLDSAYRLVQASCFCHFHMINGLNKGPCDHMLALRIAYHRQQAKSEG